MSFRDVLGIYFTVYPRAGSNEKLGFYYLNGKDDEDAVYRELMKLINGEDLNAYTKRDLSEDGIYNLLEEIGDER